MTSKRFTLGTHRALPPEDTVRNVAEQAQRVGITRVADVTGLDRVGIPVMAAYRPDSWSLAVSMGKGVTPAAAQASAVMESIELWHAEQPTLPQVWGSPDELGAGHRVVDWTGLAGAPGAEFRATTATAWVEATSLVDGDPVLVPYEAVHTDGRVPEPAGSGWFACTSNGLASGNNVVEAQVHGLCEVIERDGTTLWRLSGDTDGTAIDPDTVTDPACRGLLDRFAAAGIAVLLNDATTDVGVATVHCTIFEPGRDPRLIVYATTGMGCHPSPAVAVSRALTEAAQSRLTLISGARDDVFRPTYETPPDAAARAEALAAQLQAAVGASRTFDDLPDLATESLEADLEVVVGRVVALGLHPCWVDLTQDGVGVAVGKTVVAGLEHLIGVAGYRPGVRGRAVLAGSP